MQLWAWIPLFFSFKYLSFLGQYLVEEILKRDDLELSFVWNRTVSELRGKVDEKYILENLPSFPDRCVNIERCIDNWEMKFIQSVMQVARKKIWVLQIGVEPLIWPIAQMLSLSYRRLMIAKAILHFRNNEGNGAKLCPSFVSGIFFLGKRRPAIGHFFLVPSITVPEQLGQLHLI